MTAIHEVIGHTHESFLRADLKRLHAKQLKNLLHSFVCFVERDRDGFSSEDSEEIAEKHERAAIIKAELATRAHIPNKKEGVTARQKRAKQGRQKGRRDK